MILIGLDDELAMYPSTMPIDLLKGWDGKPWTRRLPGKATHTSSSIDDDESSLMARQPRPVPTAPDLPSSPSSLYSPSSFSDEELWQSVQVYDLHANYVRGRITSTIGERRFAQIRKTSGHWTP